MPDRPVAGQLEQRSAPDVQLDGRRLRGVIPYDVPSREMPGGWTETIDPAALRGARLDDLTVTVEHAGIPLGRYPTTLELEDRSDGAHWSVELPESRADVREAVERGDLRAGSWKMRVARERWDGDVRRILEIAELRDVAVTARPAYPSAAVEFRSAPEEGVVPMPEIITPPEAPPEAPLEARAAPESPGLPVETATASSGRTGGLAEEFRSRGFPLETATVDFDHVFEQRAATWTGSLDTLSPIRRGGAPLAFDARWAWPSFPRIAADPGTTAVQVARQSGRTLASPTNVIRALAATTAKPETSSVLEVITIPLKQVATVQSGVPNIYLEQPMFNTVIEGDLRLAVGEALDKIVLDATAASPFEDPGTDSLIVTVRTAISTLQALGYSPDLLILRPQDALALDTLTANATDEIYVFSPGEPAPTIWGLPRRISKSAAAPIVVDTAALGRLYSTAISLARFEENNGSTNTSLVRLEGHAAFGVERQDAAVRLAAA